MKNLNKVLAFVIAFTMMLGFAVSASAFPDVSDDASYAEAVTILSSLKIMIGDDHGNFNPDQTITRAEVAAIVMRAKGLEDASQGAKGATSFSDVATSHWATGYINLASQSSVIAGFPDGTFRPEDPVTYEQVTKMVVAALGYTPKAESMGGYPTGYLVIASQENISRGAMAGAGEPAKRSIVARLVFNALDVDIMDQTGFTVGAPEYSVMEGRTLLKNSLKVDKYEGVIMGTYLTEGTSYDDDSIRIRYEYLNNEREEDTKTFAEGLTNASNLFGHYVVAYVAEDEYTHDPTILAVAAKQGRNKSETLDYSQLDKSAINGAMDNGDITRIEYRVRPNDSNTVKRTIASDYRLYWNDREDLSGTNAIDFLTQTGSNYVGKVTLIDYDNDDEYEIIMVTQYTGNSVVREVDLAAERLIDRDGANISIDLDDEEVITRFYNADGSAAAFEDIEVDDVLTFAESDDHSLVKVYISKNIITGTVTESRTDAEGEVYYTIGGQEYRIADDVYVRVADEGRFFLNVDNRIVYKDTVIGGTINDNYGYLYAAAVESGIGGATVAVKFITATGEWKTANLASRVTIYETDRSASGYVSYRTENVPPRTGELVIGDEDAPFLRIGTSTEARSLTAEDNEINPQLFKYQLNSSGDVSRIYVIKDSPREIDSVFTVDVDTTDSPSTYRALDRKIGNAWMLEDTIVFSVPSTTPTDEDDIHVTRAASIFKDGNPYAIKAYDVTDGYPRVVVAYDAEADIALETNLLIIEKVTRSNNDNGLPVDKYYGYQSGVYVSGESTEDPPEIRGRDGEVDNTLEVEAGDVVIFNTDAKGLVDKIQILMKASEARTLIENGIGGQKWFDEQNDADTSDVFGYVSRRTNGRIELTDDIDGSGEVFRNNTFTIVRPNSNINVYEVNLNRTTPTVQTWEYGKILADNRTGRDGHWAYVRIFDQMEVDVVVYRVTNP